MATIKNIIFDLGGVLININYEKTKDAFIELGFNNFDEMYSQYNADELFSNLEMGKVSEEDFIQKLQNAHPENPTKEQITKAWNAMVLDFRIPSLNQLPQLAEQYNIYLFSNTNSIHMAEVDKKLEEATGRKSLDPYFKKAYYSYKMGYRKPNKDSFEFLLQDAQINKEQTIFIDDSYNNIETAHKIGMQTHLLMPDERIENLKFD